MIHHHSIEPSGGPMSVLSTNQLPIHRGQQLRRAVYIRVADLIGTYNIDSGLLEEEMVRVKTLRENPIGDDRRLFGGVPTELDTSSKKRLQPPRGGYNMVAYVFVQSIAAFQYLRFLNFGISSLLADWLEKCESLWIRIEWMGLVCDWQK
jgi:hypothetical protein